MASLQMVNNELYGSRNNDTNDATATAVYATVNKETTVRPHAGTTSVNINASVRLQQQASTEKGKLYYYIL